MLDSTDNLKLAFPCPPEGDAGTGMTATNSIAAKTGNTSAGTSIFTMIVLEGTLRGIHRNRYGYDSYRQTCRYGTLQYMYLRSRRMGKSV